MKKIIVLVLIALVTSVTFAQNNYQDVVYLKDGNIIRGIIVEQVPNESIKIETADSTIFEYNIDKIEKMTKENVAPNKSKQNLEKRKGYIGLTMGPSIPVENFSDELYGNASTGLHLNLINFGYLITDNFGIAATWFGAANGINTNEYNPWSYGGIMVGPLVSYSLSNKVDWDFRPMIGYSVTTLPNFVYGTEQASSLAFNFGTLFRIHVGNKVSLLASADYFSTKPEFKDSGFEQSIKTISLGFGAAYRLQ